MPVYVNVLIKVLPCKMSLINITDITYRVFNLLYIFYMFFTPLPVSSLTVFSLVLFDNAGRLKTVLKSV